MTALAGAGERYFRSMELSVRLPWFLVTLQIRYEEDEVLHSVCCSWESDLVELLSATSNQRVVTVQQLMPSAQREGAWDLRDIVRVSQAKHPSGRTVVVYQAADGQEFFGEFVSILGAALTEHSLLFEAAERATSAARFGQHKVDRSPDPQVVVPIYAGALDPYSVVPAEELGAMLGDMDAEEVRREEAAGRLLSVSGGYPIYQAWPGIAGEPFARLLAVLLDCELPRPHDFFVYQCPVLGNLTPVEAVIGAAIRDRVFDFEAAMVMTTNAAGRHEYLLGAARAFVADTSGW
ncbi:hypothetical protein ACVNIS_11305 [Sphaerotilaceae bacterium SBD11-9]